MLSVPTTPTEIVTNFNQWGFQRVSEVRASLDAVETYALMLPYKPDKVAREWVANDDSLYACWIRGMADAVVNRWDYMLGHSIAMLGKFGNGGKRDMPDVYPGDKVFDQFGLIRQPTAIVPLKIYLGHEGYNHSYLVPNDLVRAVEIGERLLTPFHFRGIKSADQSLETMVREAIKNQIARYITYLNTNVRRIAFETDTSFECGYRGVLQYRERSDEEWKEFFSRYPDSKR